MNRRNIILGIFLVLILAIVVAFVQRAFSGPPADRIIVSGDVRAVTRTVSAPAISYPVMVSTVVVPSMMTAGHPQQSITSLAARTNPMPSITPTSASGAPQMTAQGTPVPAGRLAQVYAQVGSHVTTGEVLAQFDTAMLDLGVEQAKLNATSTKTKVKVLRNSLDTIYDNIDKLSTAWGQISTGKAALATAKTQIVSGRAQMAKAKSQLLVARSGLTKGIKQLKAGIAQMKAALSALEEQAAGFAPNPVPPALQAKIDALKSQLATAKGTLAGLQAKLAQVNAGLQKLAAGQAKLDAAAAKIATGQAQLATAVAQLNKASDALDTAKTQVITARDSVQILSDSQPVFIALAKFKRDQATVTSPISGYVSQAVTAKTVAVVGAPLFVIVPEQPALIDTYLAPDQLARVHVGSEADVTFDSAQGRTLHATLHAIGLSAPYPPTTFPTQIVHMTHAAQVTFQLDSGASPPQGTPVDIAIHTN